MNTLRALSARSVLRQKLQANITRASAPRQSRRLFHVKQHPSSLLSSNLSLKTNPNSLLRRRTFVTGRRLRGLEAAANNAPGNPSAQAAYLRELNKVKPDEVCRRIDSGVFSSDEAVMKEYVKALVATGRLDQANLSSIAGGHHGGSVQYAGASSYQGGSSGGMFGNAFGQHGASAGTFGGNMGGNMGGMDAGMGGMGSASMGQNGGANPVMVKLVEPDAKSQFGRFVRGLLPIALLLGGTYYIMNQQMGGLGGGKSGGKSGGMFGMMAAHELKPQTSDKTFDDVCGCDEAKAELAEIADYLADPDKFTKLGGKLPKGVLLMGAPGTGKTLLARAIAGEAGVPFFYTSGSEFDEIFVGMGAKRVRELFAAAKAKTPCIVFIDEIDAVGGKRSAKDQQAMKQTLNQLLVELDGFEENEGLIVIGATNFPEALDQALIRPGRFDRHVNVGLPDVRGRTAILDHYLTTITVARDDDGNIMCDTDVMARSTPGASGADLANMVNAAALKASTDGSLGVTQLDLEYARDKILMGAERTSAFITPESKKLTAYHEGGHAVVAVHTPGAHPIHKATVMPRGRALGMVWQLPTGDQTSQSMKQMLAEMDVCMGGRVAEELIFGSEEVTSGASSDLSRATSIAQRMVMSYGMSEVVGKRQFNLNRLEDLAPDTRKAIDDEVNKLLNQSYKRASNLLKKHSKDLESVAKGLLEYETLSGEEVNDLIKGKKIRIGATA